MALAPAALALPLLLGACGSDPTPPATPDPLAPFDPPGPIVTADEAADYANPFFGSGGMGFAYGGGTPAAQHPLGLVRLGPDTGLNGAIGLPALHTSGYYAGDNSTCGFSHLHFVGTGVEDYGNLRVTPSRGERAPWDGRMWTDMDLDSEQASPGYYAVRLPDEAVDVELTASVHAGVHRYTALEAGVLHLYWDTTAAIADQPTRFGDTFTTIAEDGQTLEALVTYGGPYTGRGGQWRMNATAIADPQPDAIVLWDADGLQPDADEVSGFRSGARLTFDVAAGDVIELRVGVGPVDLDQAHQHREQVEGRSFDDVRSDARAAWSERLGRIRVAGGSEHTREVFYSALYNTWRMPTRWQGTDGRYVTMGGLEGQTDDDQIYYTDLSLWDTFRTLHPLYELIDVDTQRASLRSLLIMAEAGDGMPRWPAATSFTNGMIGSSADHLFASSALKGIDGVDYERAFTFLYRHATGPLPPESLGGRRNGIDDYLELGYLPDDRHGHSVSTTLEYAWCDASLANLAAHLGDEEAEQRLRAQSASWATLFHPELRFLRPRLADGSWNRLPREDDINMSSGAYTEGSAWHYRFYVMHDLDGLIERWGDDDDFLEQLERLFSTARRINGRDNTNGLLPEPRYWHSNEPVIDAAWVFHHLGRYDRLTHWLRTIQTSVYGTGPAGLPGNDDGGTMSAWYVFNAVGLYPRVGTDRYMIGIPLFPWAELTLDGGATLRIEAPGLTEDTSVIEAVWLNGEPLGDREVSHAELAGSVLRFLVGEAPSPP